MQTSFIEKDWVEDREEEARRRAISESTTAAEKRRLFPLSCRLKVSSQAYSFKPGQVFKYARTKHTPSPLPIEAMVWLESGKAVRILMFYAHEVELLPPQEEQTA